MSLTVFNGTGMTLLVRSVPSCPSPAVEHVIPVSGQLQREVWHKNPSAVFLISPGTKLLTLSIKDMAHMERPAAEVTFNAEKCKHVTIFCPTYSAPTCPVQYLVYSVAEK